MTARTLDGLARIEPYARELLVRVDAALIALGAPPEHPIWVGLRRLGATPGDAVAFLLAADPEPLRAAGAALREQMREYSSARIPASIPWHGVAGEAFGAQAAALRAYLGVGVEEAPDPESHCGRLDATASYVEEVADWYERSRASLARTLADVLNSTQAVTVRTCAALAGGLTSVAQLSGQVPGDAAVAAADIGAYVLSPIVDAHEAGHELLQRWGPRLVDVAYRGPSLADPARFDATIRVRH